MVSLAVFVAAMAVGVASASAFSLSSSTSTKQAAAPTDLSFTYVATGAQSLSQLDVDLPTGVMHEPSSTPACPVALFQVDRCPASARVAHTATVITVAGTQVSVPGAVFHIADPADDSALPLGIVLRPPLSALGLTGKIYLRDGISFTNGGGLRHSITGPLTTVSVLGIPVRSRIQRMSLNFAGSNATGNQLYNATSCASQPLRATATFSDGRTESRSAPYSTTGCPLVPFTATSLTTLDSPRPGVLESFSILINPDASTERGQLHDSHVQSIETDLSDVGTFDTTIFAAMPDCPTDLALSDRCPAGSKVGSFSTSVEGLTGPLTGDLHHSDESPTGIIGVFDLPGDRIVGIKIEISGVNQADSKTLKSSISSELPLETTKLKIDAPILKLHQKPASCSTRESRAVLSGHSGGWSRSSTSFPGEPCPPNVSTVDPRDDDSDGDGFADDELRAENFPVRWMVGNGGDGIDESSAQCALESPDAARGAIRGKVKVIRDTGSGYYACDVTEAAGPLTVVFSIASLDGHVTVLKMSYTVDSEAPVVESEAPEVIEVDGPDLSLDVTFTDDLIAHPQSSYKIECVIEDSTGARHTTTPGHKYIDTLTLRGGATCQWELERRGRYGVEVLVEDSVGHQTVLKRTAVVDAQGPIVTLTDWRDQDSDDDGLPDEALRLSSFNIPFSVGGDDDIDTSSISCKLINPVAMDKGLRVADLDGDGAPDVCQVTDAPGGPNTVEISAADHRGHVTVLKLAYTVDTQAPTIETTAPDKVVYDFPTFDFEFEFTDDTATHPQSKFKAGAEIEIKTGYLTSSAKIVTDRDTGRSKGFARFENVPDGDHDLTLTVEDSTGHVTVLKVAITVDTQGPVVKLTDTRDEDSDGDGFADDELRPGNFSVPFDAMDNGQPVDQSLVSCDVTDASGAQTRAKGIVKGIPTTTPTPVRFACDVSDASGVVVVSIKAADWRGHVTVLKMAYTVDSEAPIVTGLDRGFYSTPQVGDEFVVTDDTMTHPQSRYSAECRVTGDKLEGGKEGVAKIITDRDTGRSKGFCTIEDVPDGEYELALSVSDGTGHVTVLKVAITVDATGPAIKLINPEGTDSDGDGVFDETRYVRSFDRAVSVEDHSDINQSSVKCTVRGWNPETKELVAAEDLDGDGLADVCRFTDAPDGLHELEISAADVHGHVTVLKAAITVDATPPAVSILSPFSGQTFTSGSLMPIRFIATSEGPVVFTCLIDSMVVDASCTSTDSFSLGGLSGGTHTFSVRATDSRGRSATALVPFNITSPPQDVCIAIYPPPPGCPGYVPPGGGGGIIIVP